MMLLLAFRFLWPMINSCTPYFYTTTYSQRVLYVFPRLRGSHIHTTMYMYFVHILALTSTYFVK